MPSWRRGLCANGTRQLTERGQFPIRDTSCPRLDAPIQREHLLAHRGEGSAAGSASSLASLHQGLLEALIQGIEQVPRALVAHLHLASCCGDGPRLLDALQQISLTWPDLDVWPNHDAQMQGEFSGSRLQFRAPLTGPVIKAPVYSQATRSAASRSSGTDFERRVFRDHELSSRILAPVRGSRHQFAHLGTLTAAAAILEAISSQIARVAG